MQIWCKPFIKNQYTSVLPRYDVQVARKKKRLTIRFGTSGGLTIPIDVAERIAHVILAAGSEPFTASWHEAET